MSEENKDSKYNPEGIRVYEAGTSNMVADPSSLDPNEKYRFAAICNKDIIVKEVDWCLYKNVPHFTNPCDDCQMRCEHNHAASAQTISITLTPELVNFVEGCKQQIKHDKDYQWHEGLLHFVTDYDKALNKGDT